MTARFAGLPQLTADPTPDAELLRRFAAGRDESAFRELVRRHGRLVFGVCRRAVGDRHLAEDVFQAVFLVLARKATSVRDGSKLSSWLHGVAVRVGRRAQRTEQRRRWKAGLDYEPAAVSHSNDSELIAAVDAEIDRLPEAYRVPLILCELEGVSRSAAAARLNLAEGTLSSRLAAGRKKLAANLTRRGVVLGVVLATPVTVPAAVIESTIELTSGGRVPAELLSLAFGRPAMRTFLLAGVTLMAAVGAAAVAQQTPPVPPKPPEAVKVIEAKPAEPGPAYTTKPKMRRTFDVVGSFKRIFWSADGSRVGVECTNNQSEVKTRRNTIVFADVDPAAGHAQVFAEFEIPEYRTVTDVQMDADAIRVAAVFDAGGKINTIRSIEVFEYKRRGAEAKPDPAAAEPAFGLEAIKPFAVVRNVPIPAGDSVAPYFRGPGAELFLYVSRPVQRTGMISYVHLADIDSKAEDPVKPYYTLRPADGKGFRTVRYLPKVQGIMVIEGDGTCSVSTRGKGGVFQVAKLGTIPAAKRYEVAVSEEGNQAAVAIPLSAAGSLKEAVANLYRAVGEPHSLHTEDFIVAVLNGFSADGRLLSGTVVELVRPQDGSNRGVSISSNNSLVIWDTKTGERVKQWDDSARTSFAPNKSLLAIAEAVGSNRTRIGFWDFSPSK